MGLNASQFPSSTEGFAVGTGRFFVAEAPCHFRITCEGAGNRMETVHTDTNLFLITMSLCARAVEWHDLLCMEHDRHGRGTSAGMSWNGHRLPIDHDLKELPRKRPEDFPMLRLLCRCAAFLRSTVRGPDPRRALRLCAG